MKIRVNKGFIINSIKRAAREGRLKANNWVSIDPSAAEPLKECEVCAVGAVFTRLIGADPAKGDFLNNKGDRLSSYLNGWTGAPGIGISAPSQALRRSQAPAHLAAGRYMAALSCIFEESYKEKGLDGSLAETVQFVREKFPEHVTIDIDGFPRA